MTVLSDKIITRLVNQGPLILFKGKMILKYMTKINSKHGEDATITQLLERIQQHSIEAYRELEQYKNSEKRQKRTI